MIPTKMKKIIKVIFILAIIVLILGQYININPNNTICHKDITRRAFVFQVETPFTNKMFTWFLGLGKLYDGCILKGGGRQHWTNYLPLHFYYIELGWLIK